MGRSNPSKSKSGFTLIEVLIATFVLTVGILAGYALMQSSLVMISQARSRLIGVYLAQEGIELVRNQRDSNWLAGAPWGNNILPSGPPGCGSSIGKFTRTCNVTLMLGPPEKMEVSVEVSWQERGRNYHIEVENHLYNWH